MLWFRKVVGNHMFCRAVLDYQLPFFNPVVNEEMSNVNVTEPTCTRISPIKFHLYRTLIVLKQDTL